MYRILLLTKQIYTNKDLINERYGRIYEFASYLSKYKFKICSLCLNYKKSHDQKIQEKKIIWHSIGLKNYIGLFKYIYFCFKYSKKVNLIWATSDTIYGAIGYIFAKLNNIPIVYDLYDNYEYFSSSKFPFIKTIYKNIVRKVDTVVCVSPNLKNLVNTYGRHANIYIIENGIDRKVFFSQDKTKVRKRLGLPVDATIIGTIGGLNKSRGIENLILAYEILSKKINGLYLLLAGPRDVTIPKQKYLKDYGVVSSEEVPYLINALDVAVICILDNSFGRYCYPMKAVEIMSCKVPLVAAQVGVVNQMFLNSKWLFNPVDPYDIAKKIEFRLNNRNTDYPKVCNWDELGTKFENIIIDTIDRKS